MDDARRRLLEQHYPDLDRHSHHLAARFPRWRRDELVSELLVAMAVAADEWDGIPGTFLGYARARMTWAALDWIRTQDGWSRSARVRREVVAADRGDGADAHAPSGQERAETLELLDAIADLPDRERVALLAESKVTGAADLGVSETRAFQLRERAFDRLATLGLVAAPKLGQALSDQELAVLPMIADGMPDSEIAAQRHLSVAGVKAQVKGLLAKLGARNRAHAVSIAYHRGLLRTGAAASAPNPSGRS